MAKTQVSPNPATRIDLFSERLGPLPLINHFVQRMRLEEFFERHVPTTDRRCLVPHAQALLVLLRSIVVEREPIYRQYETALGFANGLFGIGPDAMAHLSDDRIGRALDHLFEADRAALLTDVVVSLARKFELRFDRIHNDSTSISFCGQYRAASGKRVRGKMAPAITYGFSKDHRPDLKQLLFILSVEADGGLPIHFRVANGNTNDSINYRASITSVQPRRTPHVDVRGPNRPRISSATHSVAVSSAGSSWSAARGVSTKPIAAHPFARLIQRYCILDVSE